MRGALADSAVRIYIQPFPLKIQEDYLSQFGIGNNRLIFVRRHKECRLAPGICAPTYVAAGQITEAVAVMQSEFLYRVLPIRREYRLQSVYCVCGFGCFRLYFFLCCVFICSARIYPFRVFCRVVWRFCAFFVFVCRFSPTFFAHHLRESAGKPGRKYCFLADFHCIERREEMRQVYKKRIAVPLRATKKRGAVLLQRQIQPAFAYAVFGIQLFASHEL